jgi:hypothetical protein
MSSINTGTINVNYPVPGVNNNSQGFRDNFSGIKNNLDTAATEITDLQNNAVVKSALAGITLNNDMANTLISNAAIRGFRSTTYNLGTNLSGQVIIDATLGDVQYGTISANVSLQFAKWAPTGTQSNIQVIMNTSNSSAVMSLPVLANGSQYYGTGTLESYVGDNEGGYIYFPSGTTRLHYNFTTIDCGGNIEIQPVNRPREATKVKITPVVPSTTGHRQGEIRFVATSSTTGNFYGFNGTAWVQLNN